jgi:diadenosine tetraphosphate (Ap4A) HIT family hydrolase
MQKNDCIFCKIVKGDIPSAKIWEDKKHIAILDVFPNTKGMTLIIPKNHYDSYAFDMPDSAYSELMLASKKVAKLIDKKLKVNRTALVMEGMGVNHVHIKLYPMHGIDKKFKEIWAKDERYFEKYPGYIMTVLGPKADMVELNKLAKQIRGK